MVFKSDWGGSWSASSRVVQEGPRPYQNGGLIALVGKPEQQKPSRSKRMEIVERMPSIDDNLLGYNLEGRQVLLRCAQNERDFDLYVAMPFVKGVTERVTGRTMMVVGSTAHHIEAMQGQFSGVMWDEEAGVKEYGNTMRWINVGKTKEGFIGLDYNVAAEMNQGVARSVDDVRFLAEMLLELGYDPAKKLFLLEPPYIREREEGKKFRAEGYVTLQDYSERRK